MSNYLGTHFYVILDEFESISPIDPMSFDNSSTDAWLADSTSDFCMLCHSQFNPVMRRRHHCRCCGLLLCKSCTENRTMVNDSVVRVCDACAVILMPPSPSSHYYGLKKWCNDHNCFSIFETSPKSAGIRYLLSVLESECVPAHFNAARTLYKLSRCHSPAMIENGAARSLLQHSLSCHCDNTALTLALFIILYSADSSGCHIDFTEFPNLDCVALIENSEGEMKRSAARLLYILCRKRVIPVPDITDLLSRSDDSWVTAFLIATLAVKYNSGTLGELQDAGPVEDVPKCNDLVRIIIGQFERGRGTAAAMYFGSIVLEYLSRTKEGVEILAASDLDGIVHAMSVNTPQSSEDSRAETHVCVRLTALILRIWRYFAETRKDGHAVLFSQVLVPMFDVIGIRSNAEGNLGLVKRMFLEMICYMVTFDDLKTSIGSEQMLSILKNMASGTGPLAEAAGKAVNSLSS